MINILNIIFEEIGAYKELNIFTSYSTSKDLSHKSVQDLLDEGFVGQKFDSESVYSAEKHIRG